VSGVADVAFIGHTMYALTAGSGCSHGLAHTTNAILKVSPNGTWKLVADLSAFLKAHPVANPEPDDFEPDGTWYSMVAVRGKLYAVEPNHGELDVISPSGEIRRVADISATKGILFQLPSPITVISLSGISTRSRSKTGPRRF